MSCSSRAIAVSEWGGREKLELIEHDVPPVAPDGVLVRVKAAGVNPVDAKIRGIETRTGQRFEPEAAMRVKHMIASHHGQYEFGSPKLPMTLEAMALHHLDHLDAKMAGTIQLLQNEATAEDGWTQYQQSQGRKFFRGRG